MQEGETSQSISGIVLGRYQLLQRIGRGGMGEVWLAEDPRLKRRVALKMLPLHSQSDEEFARRFEREARVAAALHHPHILLIHDYGRQALANGQVLAYIVMPYIEGGTLADRLEETQQQGRLLPPADALRYLTQAAEAIDYAHHQGVVHRDIKPGNMLLRDASWLLLADFGIARMLGEQGDGPPLTQTGMGFGTPEYIAPEQVQGKPTPSSDLYSLAIIAYQMFTGRLPFSAETGYAVMVQQIMTPPPPPRESNPTLPLAVEQVLLWGLAKKPEERPLSAQVFVKALQEALEGDNSFYEPTFISGQSAAGQGRSPSSPTVGRAFQSATPPQTPAEGGASAASPARTPALPRRGLLIGGVIAAATVAGLGIWEINHVLQPQAGRSSSPPRSTGAASPRAGTSGPLTLLGHNKPISCLAWSPRTATLLSAGHDDEVLIWNFSQGGTQKPAGQQHFFAAGQSLQLAWSPDGSKVAIGSGAYDQNTLDEKVLVYRSDLSGYASGFSANTLTFQGLSIIKQVSWAPSSFLVMLASINDTHGNSSDQVILWDTRRPGTRFLLHQTMAGGCNVLAFSPDGNRLAIGTSTGALLGQLHQSASGVSWQQTTIVASSGLSLNVGALTWSPDGRYLAASRSDSSQIYIWDWQHHPGQPYELITTGQSVAALAWSPDPGNPLLAALCISGQVLIWNVHVQPGQAENVSPTHSFTGMQFNSLAGDFPLAWSADGHWLAAGYSDTNDTILVWKL
jgi:serine/threonine protein kinase